MGMANRAPVNHVRKHRISTHAIERFREYGTDVTRASNDRELGDLLDETLCEALRDDVGEALLDIDREPCMLVPFTRDYWAAPGVFLLVHEDLGKGDLKHVRTLLTNGAILDMKQKKKLVPRLWTAAKGNTAATPSATASSTSIAALPGELQETPLLALTSHPMLSTVPPSLSPSLASPTAAEKPSKKEKPAAIADPLATSLQKQLETAHGEINKLTYDLTKAQEKLKKAGSAKEVQDQLDASKREVSALTLDLKLSQEHLAEARKGTKQVEAQRASLHQEVLDLRATKPAAPQGDKDAAYEAHIAQLERIILQMVDKMLARREEAK